jgi:hypothetical protein
MRHRLGLVISGLLLAGCAPDGGGEPSDGRTVHDPEPPGEGVAFDEQNPGADVGPGKADLPLTYEVPDDLPELVRPEIVVSLGGLTVHLFDRSTGFSNVYPTGVGKLGSSGKSYTPTGFFQTLDPDNGWYYIPRRYDPEYFGGFPFLRIDAENSNGFHTYGLHGPITYTCPEDGDCGLLDRDWFLVRDYVSHGCMRMEIEGIVEMFWSVRDHANVPVTIQQEVERDPQGEVVDVDTEHALYLPGEPITYGECGARPDPYEVEGRWWSKSCDPDVGLN